VSQGAHTVDIGLFKEAKERTANFCHNLFISSAIYECAIKLETIERQHKRALLINDAEMIEALGLQLQAYQSSLAFTAHMLDEIDEIST